MVKSLEILLAEPLALTKLTYEKVGDGREDPQSGSGIMSTDGTPSAELYQANGSKWSWGARPVFVQIGSRTIVGSIHSYPHHSGINGNGMPGLTFNGKETTNGHVCLYFDGSQANNDNVNNGIRHQAATDEAWIMAQQLN